MCVYANTAVRNKIRPTNNKNTKLNTSNKLFGLLYFLNFLLWMYIAFKKKSLK